MACCKGGRCQVNTRHISQQEQEKIVLNMLHKKKQKEILDKQRSKKVK